ncbi:MAG: LPS assembly protein LptD, partial [Alphaproteobacteria bacterium]|nr:LPS assembly protein LptD [Alphaproteobacteria bacterium]
YIVTPYFFDLGLDKNLFITPTLATKARAVTHLHYTQAFDTGSATLNASYGRLDLGKGAGKQAVGHYEASLVLRPQPNVEVGGSLRHNSNPGYLARLPIKSSTFTTLYSSDLYWRQYGLNHPRNRLEATAISYRDHRSSVTVDQAPRFVPELNGQFYGDTDAYGGRFQHNFAARHIQQEEFAHTQSLSAASNYQIGRVHRYGVVGNYQAGVDLSYFRYRSDRTGLKSGSKILAYPRAHASWRLPYQRDFDNATGVFEPIAGFSVTPGAINSNTLPNQDAGLLANNETLLFSSEKISGRTRRDDSTRLSLAVEYDHYWHSGTIASLLMGRSFELRAPSLSTNDAALRRFEKRDDDYIVRLRLNHRNGLFIEDRLSIDNDNNNQINAHEVETSWKNMAWNITPSLDYAYHRPDDVRKLAGRHQFTAGFTKTFGQYWALKGSTHYDLNHTEEKFRNRQLRLRYEDECLKIVAYYKRDKHVSRYLNQEQVWGMNFDLKFGG